MDVSAEAADLVVKEGIQATESAVKLAGSALKNVAALLLALKRQDNKVVGKTNAKRLARDPAPAVVIPLKREDRGRFKKLAQEYGILYFIIQQLELSMEVTTEDGYTGTLMPDYPGITVEAKGYKTSSRTVTATRSYPNLSDADASLIPRTVQDGGRTLTLADVQWQEAGGFYNATATYSGTASSKYATGYIATVEYKGEVTRTSCDTVLYTATFASHGETHFENIPQPTQAPAGTEAPDSADSAGMNWAVLVIPAALLLGLAGFGGWKLVNYIKDKKRGYVK